MCGLADSKSSMLSGQRWGWGSWGAWPLPLIAYPPPPPRPAWETELVSPLTIQETGAWEVTCLSKVTRARRCQDSEFTS